MNTFKNFLDAEYLVEQADTHIKTHLSHIEDLAIEYGKRGFDMFLEHINALTNKLQGFETNQQINAKIDGSPMILFGLDPRPNFKNQFFIALKSGLSKTNPKIIHNKKELNEYYGADITLRDKLENLLEKLPNAYKDLDKIYQGDVLFALPQDKKITKIGGENYVTFKPNVIVYAVPVDPKSILSKRVVGASVGVIVHESFRGTPINDNQAIELISAGRNVQNLVANSINTDVFLESSNYGEITVDLPDTEIKKIKSTVAKALLEIDQIDDGFDQAYTTNPVLALLKIYLNKQVDTGHQGIFGSAFKEQEFLVKAFIDGFRDFVINRYEKEKESKKTPLGKQKVDNRLNEILNFIEANYDNLQHLIIATYYMVSAKYNLLKILSMLGSKVGKTFIQKPDGTFVKTQDEGYVLFVGTNHVKIVDRLEFTKINRAEGGKKRAPLVTS